MTQLTHIIWRMVTIYDSADDQDSVVEAMLNRIEAYGPVGDQLDMMYRDQRMGLMSG